MQSCLILFLSVFLRPAGSSFRNVKFAVTYLRLNTFFRQCHCFSPTTIVAVTCMFKCYTRFAVFHFYKVPRISLQRASDHVDRGCLPMLQAREPLSLSYRGNLCTPPYFIHSHASRSSAFFNQKESCSPGSSFIPTLCERLSRM